MQIFSGILSLSDRGKKEGDTGMLIPGLIMMDFSEECPACQKSSRYVTSNLSSMIAKPKIRKTTWVEREDFFYK